MGGGGGEEEGRRWGGGGEERGGTGEGYSRECYSMGRVSLCYTSIAARAPIAEGREDHPRSDETSHDDLVGRSGMTSSPRDASILAAGAPGKSQVTTRSGETCVRGFSPAATWTGYR